MRKFVRILLKFYKTLMKIKQNSAPSFGSREDHRVDVERLAAGSRFEAHCDVPLERPSRASVHHLSRELAVPVLHNRKEFLLGAEMFEAPVDEIWLFMRKENKIPIDFD